MSKGVHDSSGCARHRSVYVCIAVKGSRIYKHYKAELTTMSKGVHDSSGCARHRSVYVCIVVKGSRVYKHYKTSVSMYVLVWYKATLPLLI